MTREEEIKQASDELFDDFTFYSKTYKMGFEAVAMWADNHPKSHWINVNDSLPNDETKLYIIYCEAYNKNGDDIENKHHEIYLANFDKETSSWSEVKIVFTDSLDSNSSKMKKARKKGIEVQLY